MKSGRKELLDRTYNALIKAALQNAPLSDVKAYIDDDFMGYGSAFDEKLNGWSKVKWMIERQRKELNDQDATIKRYPVHTIISKDDCSALIVEEIEITVQVDGEFNGFTLRLSTLLEFVKDRWMIRHFHGSTADADTPEGKAWPIEEWKRRNAELQRAVDEKTEELNNRNKELQIEAALERVRARAMAMHHSDELSETGGMLFQQMKELGINVESCWINLILPEENQIKFWTAQGENLADPLLVNGSDHPNFQYEIDTWKANKDPWIHQEAPAEEAIEGIKQIFGYDIPNPNNIEVFNLIQVRYRYGFMGVSAWHKPTQDEIEVLSRFAKAFEQTYIRFLDLQKAEAQAKEAHLEAALEKVRSAGMAMHSSKDLLAASKVLFDQLGANQLNAISCSITLVNPLEEVMELWVTHESEFAIKKVKAIDHPNFKKEIDAWKSGIEELKLSNPKEEFIKAVKDIFDFNVIDRKDRDDIHLLHVRHQFGWITLGSWDESIQQEIEICRRFAAVFEQTYTRFLDLQKAEAQAREAQIEAALERVRAASMAMHKSDQLNDVVSELYQQIKSLNFPDWGCTIIICQEDTGMLEHWYAEENQNMSHQSYNVPHEGHIVSRKQWNKWKAEESEFTIELKGSEKQDYTEFMLCETEHKYLPDDVKAGWRAPEDIYFHYVRMNCGLLEFVNVTPFDSENFPVYRRIAKVFEQSYTRFLDLQKAEAQARESQIEAALEKVRSSAMAMRKSEDLELCTNIVFEELAKLDLKIQRSGIGIFDAETKDCSLWTTVMNTEGDKELSTGITSLTIHPMLIKTFDAWLTQDTVSYVLEGKDLQDYYDIISDGHFHLSEDVIDSSSSLPKEYYYYTPFVAGGLYFFTDTQPLESDKEVLNLFADVFNLTYTRFLDLQKAEAQAREAQIEASMERVRSRAMAMHQSSELPEAANLLFLEIQKLGVPAWSAGYCIWESDEKDSATAFMSSEGVLQKPFSLPSKGVGYDFITPLQRGESFHVGELGGDEIVKHYAFMRTLPVFGEVIDGIIEAGFSIPTFQIFHVVYFSEGFLMFITYEEVPEVHDMFERFTNVFEQTYTRFLDLQKAESQADLIKTEKERLEKALGELQATQAQLIQAEKMASLGELTAGIAHEIKNPLNFVNNFSEVSGELLDEIEEEIKEGNYDEVHDIIADLKLNLEKIHHHGGRADSIVKGMLEHSRTSAGEKKETDMNALVDEYVKLAYHGLRAKDNSFNAEIETDYEKSLSKIEVVPQEIGRVLLNLVTNAFYVVDQKSKNLNGAYSPKVVIRTKELQRELEVTVSDNGNGIPADIQNKIFQPFFTTKPTGEGTGLGLSLSYDIVKSHNGDLTVESEEGKGATFILRLPKKTE